MTRSAPDPSSRLASLRGAAAPVASAPPATSARMIGTGVVPRGDTFMWRSAWRPMAAKMGADRVVDSTHSNVVEQVRKLGLEFRVGLRRGEGAFEFFEWRDERLRNVAAAVGSEMAACIGLGSHAWISPIWISPI